MLFFFFKKTEILACHISDFTQIFCTNICTGRLCFHDVTKRAVRLLGRSRSASPVRMKCVYFLPVLFKTADQFINAPVVCQASGPSGYRTGWCARVSRRASFLASLPLRPISRPLLHASSAVCDPGARSGYPVHMDRAPASTPMTVPSVPIGGCPACRPFSGDQPAADRESPRAVRPPPPPPPPPDFLPRPGPSFRHPLPEQPWRLCDSRVSACRTFHFCFFSAGVRIAQLPPSGHQDPAGILTFGTFLPRRVSQFRRGVFSFSSLTALA